MERNASAHWGGGLKDGKGSVSSESGALAHIPYNFKMRFEDEKGTNPEELIAAAHSACFSMALSLYLSNHGMTADSIDTKATITAEPVNGAFTVTREVKGPGGVVKAPADYSQLGDLLAVTIAAGFVVPLAAIALVRMARLRSA